MTPPPEISSGTKFDHYEVVSQIGRGGMGEVWKARDTKLARFVAIKFISATSAGSQAVERLRVEARAASALNHPNICTIYDFREYQGHPLIVMEFMRGETLGERLSRGPLKASEAVDIGIQVVEALVAAHRRGIIHRDIKPENVFVTEDGLVKVLDFGLAKRFPQALGVETTTSLESNLTAGGGAAGTISFMSPEQASGEELDGRTDLFSLGVVLYICATGHPPFRGKTIGLVLSSILNRAPVPPVSLNPEIPPRFQEVIFNCLEKDREFRYQSAEELRAELKRVKRDLDLIHAPSRGSLPDQDGVEVTRSTRTEPFGSRQDEATKTDRPWMARAGMAIAAIAVLAVGTTLWRSPTGSEEIVDPDSAVEQPITVAGTSLQTARESLAGGDYSAAVAAAQDALAETPDDPEAARILDEARAQIALFDEAVAEARRQLDAGDPDRAQESLETARTIDPTAPVLASLSSRLLDLLRQLNEEANAARRRAEEAASATETQPVGIAPPPTVAPEVPERVVTLADPPEPDPPAANPGPEPTTPPPPVEEASPPDAANPEPDTAEAEPEESDAVENDAETERTVASDELPAPEAAGTVADEAEIASVIRLYERAIESRDLDLLRQVKPSLSPAEIESLTESDSLAQVEMTILGIVPEGDRALVRIERRDTVANRGRPETLPPREQTLELVRTADGWVISAFAR